MKGQWAHIQARENRMIARQNRILLTSYLMENGYKSPYYIAQFWGISSNTAKLYMKEARHVRLSDSDRENIRKIQEKENCDLPTAVAKQYEKLTNPKACFIATAAYGTPFAKEINILREWRDKTLIKTYFGNIFVNFYYRISPYIAYIIRRHKTLKLLTRILLKPVIYLVRGSCGRTN